MQDILSFLGGMFGTRAIELIAATCGFANVVLIIRRSLWNYPFGIVMVILYAYIFYDYKLYSDAILQVFFLLIQIFGLFWWLKRTDDTGRVVVRSLSSRDLSLTLGAGVLGTLILGTLMAQLTDASLPYPDATTTVFSVAAQVLLARRYIQNWLIWIGVDVLAIGIYAYKGLYPTAVLYATFLGLTIQGWRFWKRAYANGGTLPA